MTVALTNPALTLRKRFGALLKARREELGMTQLDVAARVHYGWPAMVSQQERGATALPTHDLALWAEVLRFDPHDFGKQYLYFCEPAIYQCMYGDDPYVLEELPRPERTIKSAPGRPPLRSATPAPLSPGEKEVLDSE